MEGRTRTVIAKERRATSLVTDNPVFTLDALAVPKQRLNSWCGYVSNVMAFHIVESVVCTSVEKRTYPHKHYVYCLNVRWSDGEEGIIYRKYSSFFDFQGQLREELRYREDIPVPELPALRLFERENRVGKDTAEKRKKKIEDFCQQALSLPPEIICKRSVTSFFEQWPTDVLRDVKKPDSQQQQGLATKLLKLFEDNKIQKKITSLGFKKGISVDVKEHKRSSSVGNTVEGSSFGHLAPPIGSPTTSHPSLCSGSNDRLGDTSSQPTSRRGSDSDVLDSQFTVISDYEKRESNEISLREGETVEVVDKLVSGWWLVNVVDANNDGVVRQGWAPGTFLEPVGQTSETDGIVNDTSNQGRLFRALCKYKAKDEDEVSYKKGQEINVLETNMDGWWLVQVNGRKGLTPAANLEQVMDADVDDEDNEMYAYIRISMRESQLYKKAPPPRRSSTIRKVKPLVTIRSSDLSDYAEIGDFTTTPDLNGERTNSALKESFGKARSYSIGDPYCTDGKTAVTNDSENTQDLNALYTKVNKEKKTKNTPTAPCKDTKRRSAAAYVNCEVFTTSPKLPARHYSRSESAQNHGSGQDSAEKRNDVRETETPGDLNYVSVEVSSSTQTQREAVLKSEHTAPAVAYADIIPITLPKMPEEMRKPPTTGKVRHFNTKDQQRGPPSNDTRRAMVKEISERPKTQEKSKLRDDLDVPWFFGHMTRLDAEDFLERHAKQNQFLIRESVKKRGDFTMSVFHDRKVRHFLIEQTGEGQYLIGKHNFLRLKDVVKTYQKQPLFVDTKDVGVLLSDPVAGKK